MTNRPMTRGSCLCGDAAFEVGGFASQVFKCHCSKCRKAFGGASSAAVLAPADAFHWLGDAPQRSFYRSESGYGTSFCSRCGSILPLHLVGHRLYWIPAGLLDETAEIVLERHVHTDSKATWEVLDDEVERLPGGFEV